MAKDETKTAPAANAQPAEGTQAPAAAPIEPVTSEPKTYKASNEQGELEVVINEKGEAEFKFTPKVETLKPNMSAEQPKTHTLKDLLANAEPELRETISSAMKLHAEKKAGLVEGLLKTNRCKFTKEQLGKMEMDVLENLAELAQVPTYQGVALPEANADDNQAPPAPIVFTVHEGGQQKTDAA